MKRTTARAVLDPDWQPTDKDRAYAAARSLRIDDEADAFRDYHRAHGTLLLDTSAAWRTWCRNAVKWRAPKTTLGDVLGPERKAQIREWHERNGMHVPMKVRH